MNVVQHTGTKAAPGFGDPVALGTPSRKLGRIIAGLGIVVAAGAALVVGLAKPAEPKVVEVKSPAATESLDSLITAAMSDFASNDSNADSAPKQQVVNGWVARDLLHIIALQNEASAKSLDSVMATIVDSRPLPAPVDPRPARLLMILVLSLCWVGFWLIVPNPRSERQTVRA
jgi:hypothetical protein